LVCLKKQPLLLALQNPLPLKTVFHLNQRDKEIKGKGFCQKVKNFAEKSKVYCKVQQQNPLPFSSKVKYFAGFPHI
jgi:hypothetical protein